ncbi:unnamed protein product, partial [Prorocentrum cordatum]
MEGDGAEAVEGAPVLVLDGYGSEEEAVAAAEAAEALDAAGGDEATAAADEEVDDADLMSGLGAMLGGYGSGEEEEAEGQAADGAATEEGPGAEGGAAEVAAPPEEAEEDQPAEPTQKDEEEADDDYDPFAGGAAEEEPEEDGDGLETGTTVTITGLASAAGQKFNGCRGVLGPFDAASGRWQVRLSDGAGIKALKPENLVPDKPEAAELPEEECDKSDEDDDEYEPFGDVDAEVPDSVWEEEEGEDAYATWDSNEIAAAVVQAEIMGDTEKAARLGAVLRQRRKEKCGDAVDEGDIVEEVVEVPDEAVGFVIGRGGENIQRLSSESGARLTLGRGRAGEDTKARRCVVRGSAKQVAAARKLLQEAIAQGAAIAESKGKGKGKGKGKELFGKGAGGQAGVCKWYAAGFCRNRTGPDGMCRNGLHCSEAARKAEEDWIAAGGPQATPGPPAAKDPPLLLLLDLEGGGNKDCAASGPAEGAGAVDVRQDRAGVRALPPLRAARLLGPRVPLHEAAVPSGVLQRRLERGALPGGYPRPAVVGARPSRIERVGGAEARFVPVCDVRELGREDCHPSAMQPSHARHGGLRGPEAPVLALEQPEGGFPRPLPAEPGLGADGHARHAQSAQDSPLWAASPWDGRREQPVQDLETSDQGRVQRPADGPGDQFEAASEGDAQGQRLRQGCRQGFRQGLRQGPRSGHAAPPVLRRLRWPWSQRR